MMRRKVISTDRQQKMKLEGEEMTEGRIKEQHERQEWKNFRNGMSGTKNTNTEDDNEEERHIGTR